MLTLRDYQTAAIDALRGHIRGGVKRLLLLAPTGSGKTVIAAAIIGGARQRDKRILFLAHRKELINQTSRKLDAIGVDHGIMQADHWRTKPWLPVQVASVATLIRRELREAPDLMIIDECFPAGTPIDGVPIEQLKVGELVQSFNEATGQVELKPIAHVFKSHPLTLATVHMSDGRAITCTANHPFFTGSGYTQACDLKPGDSLYDPKNLHSLRSDIHAEELELLNGSDLLNAVQTDSTGAASNRAAGAVQDLREGGDAERQSNERDKAGQCALLSGMSQGPNGPRAGEVCGLAVGVQPETCERPDEGKQPDGASGDSREGQQHLASNGVEAAHTWRERLSNGATEAVSRGVGPPMRGDNLVEGHGLADSLATPGYRASNPESCNRNRREQPLRDAGERSGSSENGRAQLPRVDRVEVHKPTSDGRFRGLCPDDFVYNIEVEGNHNYFAAGLLVHNCHRAKASSYLDIIGRYPGAVLLGLTATPVRSDGKGLGSLFDVMVACPSVASMIERGHLVPVQAWTHPTADLKGIHKTAGDYDTEELAFRMNQTKLLGNIVRHWQRLGSGRQTVVFAVNVEHSKAIVQQFKAAGIRAEHLDGTTAPAERDAILVRLESGVTQVVSNCDVLSEGWDAPIVSCVILARPTMSMGKFLQMAGRALRPHPESGKVDCLILDHAGCIIAHGMVEEDREWALTTDRMVVRKSLSIADTVKVCPKCMRASAVGIQVCPGCGYAFSKPRQKNLIEEDGDLVEAQSVVVTEAQQRQRQRQYEFWLHQERHGFKKDGSPFKRGYASARFKGQYGRWPPGEWRREWESRQNVNAEVSA